MNSPDEFPRIPDEMAPFSVRTNQQKLQLEKE